MARCGGQVGGLPDFRTELPEVQDYLLDAQIGLAARTGLHYRAIPIAPMVDAFDASLHLSGLAEENLQARVRGTTLMALSNAEGHLVLATGNKTEVSVGYSTIYGDAVGGFAPIKDLYKTEVVALCRWRNAQSSAIPELVITRPPSAELRENQTDQDSLPPYEVLDGILLRYVDQDRSPEDIVADGFDAETVERVLRLLRVNEWKRRQSAPGPKLSHRAFGRERRYPISSGWRD